jgi:hypothetical protein
MAGALEITEILSGLRPVPNGWRTEPCPRCGWYEGSYRPPCAACDSTGQILLRTGRRFDSMPADGRPA